MLGCKPVDTRMDPNSKLGLLDGEIFFDASRYRRMVGKLIYLIELRPDIIFAVDVVSQYKHTLHQPHWDAMYRILRYLKSSPGKGILYTPSSSLSVIDYSDADWAGNPHDCRSTTGYYTFITGNLVTWKNKKQHVVARSSVETKY